MKESITSETQRTTEQEQQLGRLLEDAIKRAQKLWPNKINPDRDGTQNVLKNGDKLINAVVDVVLKKIVEFATPNRFANEEVASSYGYRSGYKGPKPIEEQVAILQRLFPKIGDADLLVATQTKPEQAEGPFAILRWQAVAPTYGEALEKVLELLEKAYEGNYHNYCEGKLGVQYLRQTAKNVASFERLSEEQPGKNILIAFLQLGILHRGRSVRRALEVMSDDQFGLDPFTIGIVLLTHPERLQHYDDLWIDCPGAEYAPMADGVFSEAMIFSSDSDMLEFSKSKEVDVDVAYGSASGFFPQKE